MPTKLLLATFLLLTASCKEDWTQEDKQNYLQQCHMEAAGMYSTAAQTDKYCNCNLEVVMKHYPHPDEVIENKDSIAVRKEVGDCSLQAQQ